MVRRRVAGKCLQLRHDMRIVLSLCQPVQARFVEDVHLADIFITANPWRPASSLITWAAVMRGCWVLTPETYLCNRGPALKFRPAVQVKRMVWISDAFQAANVSLFLLIAEVLNVGPHAWKVLRAPLSGLKPRSRLSSLVVLHRFWHLSQMKRRGSTVLLMCLGLIVF